MQCIIAVSDLLMKSKLASDNQQITSELVVFFFSGFRLHSASSLSMAILFDLLCLTDE